MLYWYYILVTAYVDDSEDRYANTNTTGSNRCANSNRGDRSAGEGAVVKGVARVRASVETPLRGSLEGLVAFLRGLVAFRRNCGLATQF